MVKERIDYDKRMFVSVANTDNGEVSVHTTFHYHQKDGRLRLREQCQWLNDDRSRGHSVIEEILG